MRFFLLKKSQSGERRSNPLAEKKDQTTREKSVAIILSNDPGLEIKTIAEKRRGELSGEFIRTKIINY